MAQIDKFKKSFETLKLFTIHSPKPPEKTLIPVKYLRQDNAVDKKECLRHCEILGNILISNNFRNLSEYNKFLSQSIELLFCLCNNDDPDIRNAINETFDKLISNLIESNSYRFLSEFCRAIMVSSSNRALRLALIKFSEICHRIRPNKYRAFATNLYSSIVSIIIESKDELFQEILYESICRIYPFLTPYATEKEILDLINAYLLNLSSPSNAIRRYSALSIVILCDSTRKPDHYFNISFNYVSTLISSSKMINKDDLTTGIFMLIKYSFCKVVKCIEKNEHPTIVDSLLRNLSFLYRQLISTLKYSANNILIVSTLEAMCEFFLTMPPKIFQMFNDLCDTEGAEFRSTSSLNYSFKIPSKSVDLSHNFDNLNDEMVEENQFQKSCIFFNNSSLDINSSVSEAGDNTTYDNDSPNNSEVFFDQDQESEIDTRSISENKGLEFDMMSEVSSINTTSIRCPQSPFDSSVDLINDNHLSSINFNEVNLGEIYSFKHAAKLICLKYLLRGEPGQILADNEVKVSIKVLTLACLSNIIQHNPSILFEKITCKNSSQPIQDVFIYLNHSDPNMRGQISLMIGKYLKKVLCYPLSYEDFLSENNIINNEEVSLDNLLLLLKKLLQDSSSITVKNVLISFQCFLPELLLYNEINVVFIFDLIYDLISLNNSSYWLIKVELLKLFSMLSFKHLKYFEKVWKSIPDDDYNKINVSKKFNQSLKYKSLSKTIMEEIFFVFLFENDHRVRQISLNCLPKFIENLCLNNYICHNDTINLLMFDSMLPTFNFDLSSKLFNENFPPINVFECPLDAGFQFPNSNVDTNLRSFIIESNITYFVKRFLLVLRQKYHSKLSLLSSLNALSTLSKAYPPGEHLNGWMIESIEPFKNSHNTVELVYFLIEILTKNPMVIIDLQSQQNLIALIVDLIEAICLSCFKTLQDHNQNRKEIESSNDIHEMISPDFAKCLETFFLHLYKIIVMFSSINEDNALIFVSFIHNLHTRNTSISSMIKKHSAGFFDMKDKNIWNKDGLKRREAHAYDSCSFRLFETLKNHRYRKSSQGKDSPKTTYLTIVLNSFAKILEFTSASFLCNHLEDILLYLKMIFYSNPYSITCITSKLLKCIFEINYISMFIEVYNLKSIKVERRYSKSTKSIDLNSFYNICFVWPYKFNDIFNQLNVEQMNDGLKHTSYLSWLRKWTEYKHIKIMNSDVTGLDNRSNPVLLKKFLTNKIKCFEQLVILSMKHYSMTSDRRFQSCILDLLVQLIQFHINYSLLDSDKIFLSLIIKQFEYMENIFDSESFESLMKHIFYFLSTLSREHYIPNDLVNTPKLIQLCDNLIANGHQKLAIDGLHIIIDHLFYSDCDSIPTFNAEHRIALDTQKEVILAYCFKLINIDKTFHLLLMILNHYKISCRIKWFDLSTQIIEIIMMKLSNNDIKINSIEYFESFQCLMFALCPSALAQISSNYIETMFNQFKSSNTNISFKYWLPKILIYLKLILSNLNETDLLSNMDRIKTKLDITNLNAKDSADCFEKINSVDVFAYFLLNLLQKIIMEIDNDLLNNSCCNNSHYNDNNNTDSISSISTESEMNVYFLRYYQLILAFVFQSGFFPKLTKSASSLIKQSKQDVCLNNEVFDMRIVNDIFLKICKFHPMISISWLNFLCILNYEKLPKILSKNIEKKTTRIMNNNQLHNSTNEKKLSIITLNSEILKRSSLILLCDYLSENLENVEFLSWFIINHLRDIIEHCHEMPIKEFLNTIHRNAVSSGLLLQVISSRCDELFYNAIIANKILNCLERCHNRQNIALIMFLLEKYLCNQKLAIYYKCCKYAESIITNRLMLVYKANPKSVQSIFNQEDFNNLLKILKHTSYNKLYFTVKMIRIKFYDSVGSKNKKDLNLIKDPLSQKRIPVPEIDKQWFLKMIENQMSTRQLDDSNVLNSLARLSDDNIINLMYSEKFAMNNFIFILKFVLKHYLEQQKNKFKTSSTLVDRNLEELAKSVTSVYVCYVQSILEKFPLIHNLYDGKVLEKDDVRLIFSCHKFYQNLILMFLPSFDFFLENFHSFFQNFIPQNDRTNFQQNILHLTTIYSVLNYLLENRQNYQSLMNISRVIENCLNIPSVYLQLCQIRNIHVQLILINSSHFSFENHFHLEEIHLSAAERFQNELGISLSDYKKMILMFHSLEKEHSSSEEIQEHEIPLYSILLKKIVVMFARFPSFNSLIYIPFNLFTTKNEHTWNIMIPENITNVPILASQFLCELETFKQFMFRVSNLSFMDRRQFEEIWMSLLGVFSEISNRIVSQNRQTEEINDGLILLKLVIMTITNILYDVGINSSNKNDDVQQKNIIASSSSSSSSSSSFGSRFDLIQEIIGKKSEYFDRITKLYNEPILNRSFIYKFKSIGDCELNQTIHDNVDDDKNGAMDQENNENVITIKKMQTSLHSIDLYSCIQFLIDFYSQQIKPCLSKTIHFPVVTEIAKSTFYISEIFVNQNHHRRVLDLYSDLQKIVENYDDEILNQFVSTGFCKLYSLSPTNLSTSDQDNIEKHKKILIERNFKEFFLPTRIYAIQGVKYLVESNLIKSKDLHPLLDYLVKHLNTEHIIPSSYCKEYVDELVYISFLLLDSYSEVINNVEYGKKIIKGLIKLTSKNINIRISRTLNHCFEKLIINGKISQDDANSLRNIVLKRINTTANLSFTVYMLNMIVRTSYFVGSINFDLEHEDDESDELFKTMEKLSIIFEPLKWCNSLEANVICQVLGYFLSEFFPAQDILNKCIGEFLSKQQNHYKYLINILHIIYSRLQVDCQQNDTAQDWVILSLSSFTQLVPISHALWALTCFLICASQNHWTRSCYYYFQNRFGKFSVQDKEAFFSICNNFYNEIKSDDNKMFFIKTFQKAACQPNSPYIEVLQYLCDNI